jgi:pyrimidine operon attenuation protein/uracil phosphoribosyltransferase
MLGSGEQQLIPDRRGNRLERHSISVVPGGQSHRLYLRAVPEIVRQFQSASSDSAYQLVNEQAAGAWWTHCLEAAGAPDRRISELAELLSEVITLPRLPAMEFAIAMSWYKVPADGVDPREWRNTADGERVSVGKYWDRSPEAMAQAGRALTRRILEVTIRHPMLAASDVVVAVPGHDRARVSFGERLAASVASGLHVPLIKVATQREYRPPAKDLPATGERTLRGEFTITDDLAGKRALIVDDVFRSGRTMSAVANATREADVATVCGLAAVRTMRS